MSKDTTDQSPLGLAISGGGIRSATFALGILQGLAKRKVLSKLSYLSTVSGGGYIGSWLSVWSAREAKLGLPGIHRVEECLHPEWAENKSGTGEAIPLQWLRAYGNFLAPKPGLFSADTWLIFTIWNRNTILNLLVILPFLLALLCVPWVVLCATLWLYQEVPAHIILHTGLITLFFAPVTYIALDRFNSSKFNQARGIIPAILVSISAVLFASALWRHSVDLALSINPATVGAYGGATALLCILFMLGSQIRTSLTRFRPANGIWLPQLLIAIRRGCFSLAPLIARIAIATAFGYQGLVSAYHFGLDLIGDSVASLDRLLFSAPLFSLMDCLILVGLIGCASWRLADHSRESWSRAGAWIGILFGAGLILCSIAYWGPLVIAFGVKVKTIGLPAGILWTIVSAVGTYLAQSAGTSGKPTSKRPITESLLPFAGVTFILGLLLLGASLIFFASFNLMQQPNRLWAAMNSGIPEVYCDTCRQELAPVAWGAQWSELVDEFRAEAYNFALLPVPELGFPAPVAGLAGFLLWMAVSRLFSINDFSMFSFYRNRLVRAYCGASNEDRITDAFTDLSGTDDVPLTKLNAEQVGYEHLFCTTANINLDRSGFAERKAVPFTFSPTACWYSVPISLRGGESTAGRIFKKFYKDAVDLKDATVGTAITISGAAASPNMGSHTSPILAFIMTLFNVRLGFWMFNPSEHYSSLRQFLFKSKQPWSPTGPKWGTFYYLFELFASASDHRKYIYLSDGGHFENLGLYELLRLRLPFIISIDGECDPQYKFDSLAGVLRKARSDFGHEITIDTSSIEPSSPGAWSNSHAVVGRIHYSDGSEGFLLYLKLSLSGDEPQDVLTYRKTFADFPHQSTGDQFFNESQFESYRRLGLHVSDKVFAALESHRHNYALTSRSTASLRKMFTSIENMLSPIPRNISDNFTRHTVTFKELLGELHSKPELAAIASEIRTGQPAADPTTEQQQAAFFFSQRLLQLMEDVYFDLQLEDNHQHPYLQGWVELFRDWALSAMLLNTYQETSDTFSPAFTSFFERYLASNHGSQDLN